MASCPTDHLFRAVTDRTARVFNVSGATGAVVLDISKDIFRIALSIYDGTFLRKLLKSSTHFRSISPFYTALKTPETLCFSGVFRGYKMGTWARNG